MYDPEERESHISTSDIDNECNECKEWKVYIHTNKINNKKYIGITKQKANRRWRDGGGYKGCVRFYSAIQKYGWDGFKHEIVYDNISFQEACDIERELIEQFNTRNILYGYNLQFGGESGKKHSDETKKVLSIRFSGENHPNYGKNLSDETKEKIRQSHIGNKNYNYGKKIPHETRKKMSEAHEGNKLSDETKKKISDSNKGKAKSEIHKQNMSKSRIGSKHSDETKKKMSITHIERYNDDNFVRGGWKFDEDTKAKISKMRRDSAKKIFCITTGEIFNSMTDASEKYGIDGAAICKCCKGTRKTCGGMEWCYYEDLSLLM